MDCSATRSNCARLYRDNDRRITRAVRVGLIKLLERFFMSTMSLLFFLIFVFLVETLLFYAIKSGLDDRPEPIIRIEGNKFTDGKCSVTIKGNPGVSFEVITGEAKTFLSGKD